MVQTLTTKDGSFNWAPLSSDGLGFTRLLLLLLLLLLPLATVEASFPLLEPIVGKLSFLSLLSKVLRPLLASFGFLFILKGSIFKKIEF
jgi:hypothetical protein